MGCLKLTYDENTSPLFVSTRNFEAVEKSSLECNHFELRNYDPVVSRWLSVDPERQFWSAYVGMANNPISIIDANGAWGSPPDDYFLDANAVLIDVVVNDKPDRIFMANENGIFQELIFNDPTMDFGIMTLARIGDQVVYNTNTNNVVWFLEISGIPVPSIHLGSTVTLLTKILGVI